MPPVPAASLLVFTLGADRERARRRLLPSRLGRVELDLHRRGLEAALEAGREAGCRVEIAAPEPLPLGPVLGREVRQWRQRGGSFGERLRRAMASAEERADGKPLIAVGSDVPGLEARHLRQALEELGEDGRRVVVGPSPDGGFYLLAARRPLAPLLAGVRWRRRDTLQSLIAALYAAGCTVCLLPPLADLDHRADLERWLATGRPAAVRWQRLWRLLRRLLAELRRPAAPVALGALRPVLAAVPRGRAPPPAGSA